MPIINQNGRRLLVEFTCGRCNAKTLVDFDESPHGQGFRGTLMAQPVPNGWRVDTGGLPLLCPTCSKALMHFMASPEEQEALL